MGFEVDPGAFDELERMLLRHADDAEKIATPMLQAGARVLIGAHQSALMRVGLSGTAATVTAGSVRKTSDGLGMAISVQPVGKMPHGVPRSGQRSKVTRQQPAFVKEYGSSKQAAQPWRASANRAAEPSVRAAMTKVWEDILP